MRFTIEWNYKPKDLLDDSKLRKLIADFLTKLAKHEDVFNVSIEMFENLWDEEYNREENKK